MSALMHVSALAPRRAVHVGKRWLYLVHRWLGIGACVLFLLWFISGVVMMYIPYPSLTAAERVAGLAPIDWSKVSIGPDAALAKAGLGEYPGELRLEMQRGEPVWRVRGDERIALSAVDGRAIGPVDAQTAGAIAREFAGGARPIRVETFERDQWTVAQGFNWARPLHKVVFDDARGTELYVASTTGEVIQNSTRAERGWNWIGAVPHWLYLTVIRQSGSAWRQVVMWTSGPATIVGITGIWIGILRMRLRTRYRSGSISPYRSGWMRWHHVVGLIGGLTAITWMASGWLSVNPFQWFERDGAAGAGERYATHAEADFPPIGPAGLARALPGAKIARFSFVEGRPLVTLMRDTKPALGVTPAGGAIRYAEADLLRMARVVVPGAPIASSAMVREPDLYWYVRAPGIFRPALRVKFGDADRTWAYLNPATGELLGTQNASGRTYRWLFDAIHDFDLPLLLAHRLVRDPLMWALSVLGVITSLSGIVIGWRRLFRRKGDPVPRPA